MNKVKALTIGFVLAIAPAAAAAPYVVVKPPVHMGTYTRNTQTLTCKAGDTAINKGHWFQHDGVPTKYTKQAGDAGNENPIFDADGDRILGYQINVQNDDIPANLFDYIECYPNNDPSAQ